MSLGALLFALGTATTLLTGAYLLFTIALYRRPVTVVGPPGRLGRPGDGELHWFIVVAALNEAKVISNTVCSLLALDQDRGPVRVIVVDDASDDGTGELVSSLASARVEVLRREMPDARRGKGDALNAAFHRIFTEVLDRGLDPARVIVGVVDGDGRLDPDATAIVGRYFDAPEVGAVQLRVRISNRRSGWLTRFQDYEFLTFSALTQSARRHLGSVGLGGNGQFTRLRALQDMAAERGAEAGPSGGPWTACLTEDLDLGLRLALAGWRNEFATGAEVRQQGVASLSRVVRQRTRWLHGHIQCWRFLPTLARSALPTATVLDLAWYLLAPATCLVLSIVFGLTVPLLFVVGGWNALVTGGVTWSWWYAVAYAASFGPAMALAGMYRRQAGDVCWVRALVLAHLLWLYNYVWYAAVWRAVGRVATGRRGWAKTARVAEPAALSAT